MLGVTVRAVRDWARRQESRIPGGYSWTFVLTVDVTMVVIGAVATLQRPTSDWPVALLANAVAIIPWALFFVFNGVACSAPALWAAWTGGAAILLFGTSTPIHGDFAPLLLQLTVGVVGAITSIRGGILAAVSAAVLLAVAAATDRIETPALYLTFVGIAWLIGYLVRGQQILLVKQREAQAQLAAHAAADERRRIAREVHDVIAHSLSITLLHLTAARHTLQHDGGGTAADAEAVNALLQAERLGRQAMADIRRTVGLLDPDASTRAPEPGVADIPTLVEDFARAGLDVTADIGGDLDHVSAAAGLALYRIAQESLSNIAKHAPDSPAAMTLRASRTAATLAVVNELPSPAPADTAHGRGLRGMRQRIELLGGTIAIGSCPAGWSVQATVPTFAVETGARAS